MANWLEKIMPRPAAQVKRNLPATSRNRPPAAGPLLPDGLPNASVVYGVAASVLFVVAIYFLFTGLWFTGLLVLLPAACFLGFALHFIKHPH